jgi:hypothetical protein
MRTGPRGLILNSSDPLERIVKRSDLLVVLSKESGEFVQSRFGVPARLQAGQRRLTTDLGRLQWNGLSGGSSGWSVGPSSCSHFVQDFHERGRDFG